MNKIIKEFLIPYSVLIILVLIESKIQSKFPEKELNFLGIKKDSKNHIKEVYYLNSPHVLIYSSSKAYDSYLTDLSASQFISNDELLSNNTRIKILSKGEKIDIYTTKDPEHFQDFFRFEDIDGYLPGNEKSRKLVLSKTATEKEVHPLTSALEDITQGKKATVELCLPFRDNAFAESVYDETPASIIEMVKQRNIEFLNYQIAKSKLQNEIKILTSELKVSGKEMNQCYSLNIKNLKYYFVAINLSR